LARKTTPQKREGKRGPQNSKLLPGDTKSPYALLVEHFWATPWRYARGKAGKWNYFQMGGEESGDNARVTKGRWVYLD